MSGIYLSYIYILTFLQVPDVCQRPFRRAAAARPSRRRRAATASAATGLRRAAAGLAVSRHARVGETAARPAAVSGSPPRSGAMRPLRRAISKSRYNYT